MTLVATYPLGIKRYQEGATDAHGNPVESWSAPETVDVFAVAPTASSEPFQAGRDAVITGLSVLAPLGVVLDPRDRAVWHGQEYAIEGEPADWSNGPFSFKPGLQFNLKKVDG